MKTLFTSSCILLINFLNAQTAPAIEWQNTIGGNQSESVESIQLTSDGGYILGGWSYSGISGDKSEANLGSFFTVDYWVIKLSSAGTIEWQNTIGGDNNDYLNSIQQTFDGGYILGGSSSSGISDDKTEANFGEYDYWVVKLDDDGNIEWQNTIGGSSNDDLHSIQQTLDGGYILGGSSMSGISVDKTEAGNGGNDYWVIKLNSIGSIEWQESIGGSHFEYLYALEKTTDGGYIIGGNSNSGISGDKIEASLGSYDYWIVKLDSDGNIEWQNTIGGNDYDGLYSTKQTSDGGYILCGYSGSDISGDKVEASLGSYDYWIVKLDSDGSIEWQNTIGGSDYDDPSSIQQTTDDGYIIGGRSNSGISGDKTEANIGSYYDYWIVKLDTEGSIKWQNTIGGNDFDWLNSIQQTLDGGYIFGGYSYSGISGDKTEGNLGGADIWIVKLFSEDAVCSSAPTDLYANNITSSKAKLHWSADPDAIKYKVQYRSATSPVWLSLNATTNSKKIPGLAANTTYKYRVRSQCSATLVSPWSAVATFTTLPLKEGVTGEWSIVNIYPNPAHDEINLKLNTHNSSLITHLNIYDITGRLMKSEMVNSDRAIINVQSLSAGIYLFELIADGMETQIQKVIIE